MIRLHWLMGIAAAMAATTASAQIADASGDWLATYTGAHNGDLDILSADVFFDGTSFHLTSTQNGSVGTSPGSVYAWGINRGAGTPRLTVQGAPPAIGPDKLFDALTVLFPNGTARVVTLPAMGPPTITPLVSGATVAGNRISAVVPLSMLPSTGFSARDYVFTLWVRNRLDPAMDGNNSEVADFAPDAAGFTARVPEPASWAMMLLGFGIAGSALRSRRAPRRFLRA